MSEELDRIPVDIESHVFEESADAMPHMVWLADLKGVAVYHNRQILEYNGLSAEANLGNGWEGMVHADDLPATRERWNHSVNTLEPLELEYRLRRHDGQYRWFLARANVQRNELGAMVRWVGTCTDIEDRKRAEARFRALIEQSFDAVKLVSADGTVIYDNPASVRLQGMGVGDQVGRSVFEVVHPDDVPVVRELFARLLANPGGRAEAVFRRLNPAAEYGWLEARGVNLLHDPSVQAIVFHIRDVDERVTGAQLLQESERRYRELFESNPHPMWVYDTETYRFLAVNDAAVERYGYSREEFLSLSVKDIRPPEDIPALIDDVRNANKGLEPRGQWRHCWKDGTIRQVEVSAHTMQFMDRPARLVLALDVTERHQAEADAARRLAQLRAVVASMVDGLVIADARGNLIDWNPAALRMHGYSTIEEAHRDLPGFAERFALFRADGSSLAMSDWPMSRVLRGEIVSDEQLLFRRLDTGQELVIWVNGVPVRGPQGEIELGVVTLHDLTQRNRAEGNVRQTAELLKAVAESTSDAVFVKDREGRYLLCNPAAAYYIGKPVQEILGRTDAEFFDEASAHFLRTRDLAVMESNRQDTDEETLTTGGVTRTFLATKGPYRDGQGKVIGIVGISHDITESQRLAVERAGLLTRLQLHVERMPLIYILYDADFLITDWNPAAERVFGYSKSEALGKKPADLVPASFREESDALLTRLHAGDMTAHSVNQNLTKEERTIVCEWLNTPLMDADGRFTGLLCLGQDVTQRMVLEEQFRQAQKMEAVGRLAGGVAHDFNNLLTVINGYSDLLIQRLPTDDPSRALLGEILKAGERSAGLTRQLLAFSRQTVLETRVLDPIVLVRDAERLLKRLIGEDVEMVVALDETTGRVKADPGQLEQALVNLCVNARDAMPEGGRLTIEVRNAELDDADRSRFPDLVPGAYVELTVADTGQGLDETTRAQIFEPFFTTKEVGKGTGLGLAMVYGFVKQSGGHICVESEPGQGATFHFYLPRMPDLATNEYPQLGSSSMPRGCETVLLVEDEDSLRALARHVLENRGYKVLEAANGQNAVDLADSHQERIDLLVTDVVMPGGMGGRRVAEAVQRSHPETRVLFVSGYTDDAVVRHGVQYEGVNFLQKPFTPTVLAQKVRDVLDVPED